MPPTRPLPVLFALAVASVLLTGCGVVPSGPDREADRHAENASYAMQDDGYEVPANDAAWQVVGDVGDVAIEAMALEGTSWDGEVTLRITVTQEASGWISAGRSVRCYRYDLSHSAANAYRRVDCPPGDPLVLTEPPHPDLSSTGAAALAAQLSALAAADRTPDSVARLLTAAYPPPVGSGAYPGPDGVTVGVSYHGHCMTGLVPSDGPATVTRLPDLTCRGG